MRELLCSCDLFTKASSMSGQVLICDDHPYITKMVELSLLKDGLQPETCSSGEAAWRSIELNSPQLLICDCEMPGMNGLELCRRIRSDERFENLPIILLTAKAFQLSSTVLKQELNIIAIIKKPFSPRELRQKVVSILNKVQVQASPEDLAS